MDKVFHRLMLTYQKENRIKNNCITNAQYLYDLINKNCVNKVKARAVIVYNSEKHILCHGHLVLEYEDGTFIDPSYDLASLDNCKYFTDIRQLNLKKSIKKNVLSQHILFCKYAERINQGDLVINDKKYYDDQADYVDKFLRILLKE